MIRIGEPATTIDTPLEHLTACHRRIEDRLATLGRAADHWLDAPEAALEAIRKSILFLDSNGALHTMDEEVSLVPRLRPRLTGEEVAQLDLRQPARKDHNAGGKSSWMQGFFDRPSPPLWKAIRD